MGKFKKSANWHINCPKYLGLLVVVCQFAPVLSVMPSFKLTQHYESVTFHTMFVFSHINFRHDPSSITFQVL